jgi:hypothetical protein
MCRSFAPLPWYTLGDHSRYTLADYGWYTLGDSRWYSIARLLTDTPTPRRDDVPIVAIANVRPVRQAIEATAGLSVTTW